ncbi:archease [Candidatus Woesearchaeota archaeon]|nr:archease [Candidatus Woesearchaeota archaeon]
MKHFVFLDDVAVADIAFDAYGKTLEELFEHCAEAIFTMMVNLKTVDTTIEREIHLRADSLENLLYDFLSELVYLKDTELLLFKTVKVTLGKDSKEHTLAAELRGETIDREKHNLGNDVKAITMHQFTITKEKTGYKARVVVDI